MDDVCLIVCKPLQNRASKIRGCFGKISDGSPMQKHAGAYIMNMKMKMMMKR